MPPNTRGFLAPAAIPERIVRRTSPAGSPLAPALGRYAGFFALFEDFQGYVDFFLLQDLVRADCEAVRFFMPLNDFGPPGIPRDLDTYRIQAADAQWRWRTVHCNTR